MHNEEIREMKHDKVELQERIDRQAKKIIELESEVARLQLYNSTLNEESGSSNIVLVKYQEAIKKRDDKNNALQFELQKLKNTYNDEINKYRVKLATKKQLGEEKDPEALDKSLIKMKREIFSRSGISGERVETLNQRDANPNAPKTQAESDFLRYQSFVFFR